MAAAREKIMGAVREITVDIGGITHRIASDDDYLDHVGGSFEPDTVRLLRSVGTGARTILDIGANIGCTTLLFSAMASSVHAFEPSTSTFGYLRRNVAASGRTNVQLHNLGLGDAPMHSTLTFAASNRSGGFVSQQTQASSGHVVESIEVAVLDTLAESQGIADVDLVKIDVEGFEAHVLRGATRLLEQSRPVVMLELNHWCLNAFQRTSVPDFLDELRRRFPILLAVEGTQYLDLHDPSESYIVMYHHILHMRFVNIVAAFDEGRLAEFRSAYSHGYTG